MNLKESFLNKQKLIGQNANSIQLKMPKNSCKSSELKIHKKIIKLTDRYVHQS